jgi:hypothetical protein
MPANILEIQFKLLSSEAARKEFAADPKAYLKKQGVDLPSDMHVPEKINLDVLNAKLDIAHKRLTDRGIKIEAGGKVDMGQEYAGRTLSDVFAPETNDVASVRRRIDHFRNTVRPQGETVAVMAAVVEVVVAP